MSAINTQSLNVSNTDCKDKDNHFELSFYDKRTAIVHGANEILPETTQNQNIAKYYNWFTNAAERSNLEKSDLWFDKYVKELLKECKKPLNKNRTESEI